VLDGSEDVEVVRNGWVSKSGGLGNRGIDSCNKNEVTCRDLVCWDEVSKGRISVIGVIY
jgi:hypothetical protein